MPARFIANMSGDLFWAIVHFMMMTRLKLSTMMMFWVIFLALRVIIYQADRHFTPWLIHSVAHWLLIYLLRDLLSGEKSAKFRVWDFPHSACYRKHTVTRCVVVSYHSSHLIWPHLNWRRFVSAEWQRVHYGAVYFVPIWRGHGELGPSQPSTSVFGFYPPHHLIVPSSSTRSLN